MLLCIVLGAILIYSRAYVVSDFLIVSNAMETWFKILKVFILLKFKYLMHFLKNRFDQFITDSDSDSELTLDRFWIRFRFLKHCIGDHKEVCYHKGETLAHMDHQSSNPSIKHAKSLKLERLLSYQTLDSRASLITSVLGLPS